MAAVEAAGPVPDYEVAELYTRGFCVGAFGHCWWQQLGQPDLSLAAEEAAEADAAVAAELACAAETVAELRAVCSIDMLMPSDKEEDPDVIPEDSSLLTLRIRKKALERREETIIVDRACRQETLAYEMESHAIGKRPDDPVDLVEEGELLLTLNIFYPVIFQKHKDHKPYQTVLVLGGQKLTELRDSISCVSDLQIGGEFSSQPDQAPEHISKVFPKASGLGMGKRLGGDTVRTADPNWPKGYAMHMALCSAIRTGGKEKRGHSWLRHLSSKATTMHADALLPQKWLDITCSWEVENESLFALLLRAAFAFFTKGPLSQPMSLPFPLSC
ncbi:snRNA-activating protein complex subunit 3 isoform X2 [Balearica regulorum gibbericeps]|uniref:snRNA-activating protein complex subunit 3 isoform X2 n=1 Tax=Balearica regulorum gibbericeps TaxID=100784 RepID=UPI003F5E749C